MKQALHRLGSSAGRPTRPRHRCRDGHRLLDGLVRARGTDDLAGRIFHLWHGDLADRGYTRRQVLLADFDPFADIALDAQGSWRWSSDKPDLHAAVRRCFESRRGDGRTAGGVTRP
jgi:hypothetical protein